MPRVAFTPQLQRFLDAPPAAVEGTTVRDALDQVFAANPRLRGYILDELGRVRTHVTVFVGEARLVDRTTLADAVGPDTEIFVLQALSGGAPAAAAGDGR
jgi:sulfur-carrier protein